MTFPPWSCVLALRHRAWRSATVRIGSLTRYGAVTRDGKGEAVEGLVIGLKGADASKVVQGVAHA
jgi:Cu/Ag efflux pump CusA